MDDLKATHAMTWPDKRWIMWQSWLYMAYDTACAYYVCADDADVRCWDNWDKCNDCPVDHLDKQCDYYSSTEAPVISTH